MLLTLAACGESSAEPTEEPTAPAPELHTVAPASDDDPEWAHVDASMALEDDANIYAKGGDFMSFALIGSDDGAEIRFKLDDVTAGMLRGQDPENQYYITLNDEKIGGAKLNENCDELTLVGEFSYEELCSLADRIRGFE